MKVAASGGSGVAIPEPVLPELELLELELLEPVEPLLLLEPEEPLEPVELAPLAPELPLLLLPEPLLLELVVPVLPPPTLVFPPELEPEPDLLSPQATSAAAAQMASNRRIFPSRPTRGQRAADYNAPAAGTKKPHREYGSRRRVYRVGGISMRSLNATLIAAALALSACSHGPVTRVDPRSTIDLSGHWNDADANQVADKMIAESLRNGWADRFASGHAGQTPVVRLYPIRNRSDDHVNELFFTKQVEQSLLQSGRVRVVEAFEEAGDNRFERGDQGQFASPQTQHPEHMETGADYVLNGWVVTQNDAAEGAEVRAYLVTMELSNTTTNEKVWLGTHQIKKLIEH